MKIKVVKMISYDKAEKYKKNLGGLGGFFDNGMRWKDYINNIMEKYQPYFEAFREYAIKNNLKICGDEHQDEKNGIPLFNDKTVILNSYRAQGDLMAAIWSDEENKDYSYMSFYMRTCYD